MSPDKVVSTNPSFQSLMLTKNGLSQIMVRFFGTTCPLCVKTVYIRKVIDGTILSCLLYIIEINKTRCYSSLLTHMYLFSIWLSAVVYNVSKVMNYICACSIQIGWAHYQRYLLITHHGTRPLHLMNLLFFYILSESSFDLNHKACATKSQKAACVSSHFFGNLR